MRFHFIVYNLSRCMTVAVVHMAQLFANLFNRRLVVAAIKNVKQHDGIDRVSHMNFTGAYFGMYQLLRTQTLANDFADVLAGYTVE